MIGLPHVFNLWHHFINYVSILCFHYVILTSALSIIAALTSPSANEQEIERLA